MIQKSTRSVNQLFIILFLFLTFSSGSYAATPPKIGPNAAIEFNAGTSEITREAEGKLKDLMIDARGEGEIQEALVAAWSDNPAPRNQEELSKPDRDLAEKRAKNIKSYLEK